MKPLSPYMALSLIALAIATSSSFAQQKYPVKPVRLVLPFSAGSAADVLARLYAQRMTESWGQQVIVDNRTGANGIIGMEAIARAAPDGYTVGVANIGTLAINPALYPKLPYDSLRDYVPVSLTATIGNGLIVHPTFPVKAVQELVAQAKKRPGQVNYATGGVGSAQHIAMEMLQAMTGIKLTHIAYKGITPGFNDVMAGHVLMTYLSLAQSLPYHRNGRLRLIGTGGAKRASTTMDIPTIAEQGVPGFEASSWLGVLLPRGTPPEIVSQVHAEVVRITQLPDTRERLIAAGFDPVGSTSDAFEALIKNDLARLGKVIRDANIRAD